LDNIDFISASTRDLQTLGRGLFHLTAGKGIAALLPIWEHKLKPTDVRLVISVDEPELQELPWELLCDDRSFLGRRMVLVRRLSRAVRANIDLGPPLCALVISAAPDGDYFFDEKHYVDPVRTVLKDAGVDVTYLGGSDATQDRIREVLQSKSFDLLHFVGHGTYQDGTGYLLVRGGDGGPEKLPGSDLAAALKQAGTKFAFFASCQTGRTSKKYPFRGVAASLLAQEVPAVAAMQYNIAQEHARVLTRTFYRTLASVGSIDAAMYDARQSVREWEAGWCVAALYAQYDSGVIQLRERAALVAPPPTEINPASENPFISFGSPAGPEEFLVQPEITNDLIDVILQRRNVLVVGEERIGKTSLLKHLERREVRERFGLDPERHLAVYIDISALEKRDFDGFWSELLVALVRELEDDEADPLLEELRSGNLTPYVVRPLIEKLATRHEVIFLLDEFQELLAEIKEDTDEFFDYLCTLNDTYGVRFAASTRYRPSHYLRRGLRACYSFFESCQILELRPFSRDEIPRFLELFLEPHERAVFLDRIDLLEALSGLFPYYLQVACWAMYANPGGDLRTTIEKFWGQAAISLRNHWTDSDRNEQIVLAALALRGRGLSSVPRLSRASVETYCPNAQATLEGLLQRGLVKERGEYVGLFAASFEAWILGELAAESGPLSPASTAQVYERRYNRKLQDDIPIHVDQAAGALGRLKPIYWSNFTWWMRQPRFREHSVRLIGLLPCPMQPVAYLCGVVPK
jgi:hypothetical protein